jgi:5-methylthioribose kinase
MDATTVDLGTTAGLQNYLSDTPFASEEITVLAGGTANFTYRIKLKAPYDGRSTVVVKHAKPYVMASGQKVPFATSRQVMYMRCHKP